MKKSDCDKFSWAQKLVVTYIPTSISLEPREGLRAGQEGLGSGFSSDDKWRAGKQFEKEKVGERWRRIDNGNSPGKGNM